MEVDQATQQQQVEQPAAEAQGWATFYSWMEVYEDGPKVKGANTVIHINGGERHVDSGGKVYNTPNHEVKFYNGILHTDSPDAIKDLRRQIARGANITEDYELYLAKVMEPKRFIERQKLINEVTIAENARLRADNSRLTEILRAQGSAARVEADKQADTAAEQGAEAAAESGRRRTK